MLPGLKKADKCDHLQMDENCKCIDCRKWIGLKSRNIYRRNNENRVAHVEGFTWDSEDVLL